ncbi:MAG: 3-hydroxyacyl-CoA dehydrogenase NAD-binding domain-containing protein [Candidatus Binatus sp.]|uniref:3-hydroxyacyl-CoA dehydrogenase n=1 Tax=Candidatus Binatus sp. TaxID=2811406 RepID=UPI0027161A3C|nr:3-hydroxyacyl-CoA dehydrogenase [Candidatus Binatus sp.]MDO8434408.1 3-hydroxyacyl-CoA dehydrogenase NAD-binding domain-containing protein [Candidatus Binatus sp.]
MADNNKVVIIGANGTMGAGAGCVFAGAGFSVTLLARSNDKCADALADVQNLARADAIAERISLGTYDRDLARAVGEAGLIFESLAEDLPLKKQFFELVDKYRRPDAIVATGSSGLSIGAMAAGRSESFRHHFLGIHLFNPPHVIVGTEVIPSPETDAEVVKNCVAILTKRLGRKVIVTKDRPAFVGNRVGFKVLNEVAQLATEHGVAFMDYLIGPHTGRAMAPLATVDLVGWDVHQAIVDNVFANTNDEARDCFKMPAYMHRALEQGCLGDKTPQRGGFYRRSGAEVFVLDPKTGNHVPMVKPAPIEFVEQMKQFHRVGRYSDALKVFADAKTADADLCRRVVLGYVSYALNRVGEVAATPADVDTIMSYGFNWAPPTAIVDLLGAKNTVAMLERLGLPVPPALGQAASSDAKLFVGGVLQYGRTFVG